MAFEAKILVDIMEQIAARVRYKLAGTSNEFSNDAPYFDYNTQVKMVNLLTERTGGIASKYTKYPLIFLQLPIPENHNVDPPLLFEATATIWLFSDTKPDIAAKDRYDLNFRQKLYPIFEALVDEITKADDFFHGYRGSWHDFEKTDLMYWGNGSANVATDFIDAIELRNCKLRVINKKTC